LPDRRYYDRKKGRTTFFLVRDADDFVVCTEGTRDQTEAEKLALAEFLRQELAVRLHH
jgi:hypothetical protein